LYRCTIRAAEVIDFLGHLLRHLAGKLQVVSHGLPARRGRAVKEFIAEHRARLATEQLSAYVPKLNSVGIHLGLPEKSRTMELLPPRLRRN